jgi:hypothetical protein
LGYKIVYLFRNPGQSPGGPEHYVWDRNHSVMDAYTFCLALGGLGLVVMGLRAVGHGHGHPGANQLGHSGGHHPTGDHPTLSPGHGASASHAPVAGHASAPHHAAAHPAGSREFGKSAWHWASPRVWFSVLVGAGATGLVAKSFLFEPLVAGFAVLGGLAFERFLVGPIWNFLLRFESRPALTLESALYEEVIADTDFDQAGQGIVRVELDGQVVQLLGTLAPGDRAGNRIRRGARLRVEEVDGSRNRCVVSRIGSEGSEENA